MNSPWYRESTPIEEYFVRGRAVFVKREDLYGIHPVPPLGKLRGLRALLRTYQADGIRLVGCWDTRVSRLGEGLAAAITEFPGLRAVVSYPVRKGEEIPPAIRAAEALGAEVISIRGNHVDICYAQIRRQIEARGGRLLPFGLECREGVHGVAEEAAKTPPELLSGTVILCCGSGVTLSGLLVGLPKVPRRLVGLSSGRSLEKIRGCVTRLAGSIPPSVRLLPATMPYDQTPKVTAPFPSHPNYDLKAWAFLTRAIRRLPEPILFWNIGS